MEEASALCSVKMAGGAELGDAVPVCFKIVDEKDVLDVEGIGEVADVELPREVGELDAAVSHGSGAAEAGGDDAVLEGLGGLD